MKKLISLLLIAIMLILSVSCFASCNKSNGNQSNSATSSGVNDKNNSQSQEDDKNQSDENQNSNTQSVSQGLAYQTRNGQITITGMGICRDVEVVIPQEIESFPVTKIASNAFENTNIVSISIPETIIEIGADAFDGCSALKKVQITNVSAWCEISFLETGHTPNSNPMCNGADLYLNGKIVREIVIPDGIKTIKQYAFHGCKSVVNIFIPDSVETISMGAFSECTNIRSVELGDSVRNIFTSITYEWEYPFYECYIIEIINHSPLEITEGSSNYGQLAKYAKLVHSGESKLLNNGDYVFFSYRNVNYLTNYLGDEYSLVLPDEYNGNSYAIASGSLYNDNIVSLTIPQSVTSIDYHAISSNCLIEIVNNSSSSIDINTLSLGSRSPQEIHTGSSRLSNHDGYLLYINSNAVVYLVYYIGDKTSIMLDTEINGKEYKIEYLFLNSIKGCTVYYTGTFNEWNKICTYSDIENIYYYSEVEPTDLKNYWHYVNGIPIIWE